MDVEQLSINDSASSELYDVRHGFSVGATNLLVKSGIYSELVATPFICSVPDTPVWFSGFSNHRGDVIPVYDLEKYCSPEADSTRKPWLLLIDISPKTVGILVNSSPQSVVSPQLLDQAAKNTQSPLEAFFGSSFLARDEQWYEFDHEQCFDALKKQF